MKQIHYLLGMLLIAGIATNASAQVSNDNEDGVYKVQKHQQKDYVPGQVLFKLKDGQQANVRRAGGALQAGISALDVVLKEYAVEEMEQLLPNAKVTGTPRRAKAYNGEAIVEHDLTQLYKVTLSEEKLANTMQLVEKLKALDEVEFAEPNYKVYMMDATIDGFSGGNPYAASQWYLEDYGVTVLWNKPIINPQRPVIAILDTGVDMTHPDLSPNLWTNAGENQGEDGYDNDGNGFKNDLHGWDFINNTGKIRDFNMHGTHVAGIAAAANNGIGIVGANPKAYIMPVTVMQSDGTGDVATIVKGIDYAVANGATILNLSLGTYANSRAMRQALERAYQKAVIVAAAGNDNKCINPPFGAPMFPAAYSFVLGVQATQKEINILRGDYLTSFSNYDDDGNTFSSVTTLQDPDGFNYELKAPGTSMLSTIPGGKYKALHGTSMAAPLVAGAISALKMVKQYDTQEILWGDLLHTNNIAQAYAVTARPAELDLMKIMYRERKELADETEEDYSGDGRIDAGETVSLYPVIRTTFGPASNIKMYLEMGDEFEDPNTVQILTGAQNKVDFGLHLDAYGKGVSLNPLKLKVTENVANGRHIKMKFVATCDETNTIYEGHFTIIVDNAAKLSGLISEDKTLTSDHIYYVVQNLGIMENATLTIEPGTRLEFAEGMGITIGEGGKIVANGTPSKPIVFTGHNGAKWAGIRLPNYSSSSSNSISYCQINGVYLEKEVYQPYYADCVFTDISGTPNHFFSGLTGERITIHMSSLTRGWEWLTDSEWNASFDINVTNSNIINNQWTDTWRRSKSLPNFSSIKSNNYFNCFAYYRESGAYYHKEYSITNYKNNPSVAHSDNPSYFGTGKESVIRPYIFELGNAPETYGTVDLSNMLTQPVSEAHGIVWKVCVNGKDAQDEYEDIAPLGVGKHKFEVYFNRPMNKAVVPQISFGVRDPYTQNAVEEDGSWNEEGTIYTAYKTITGKTKSDGVNRIYVWGAEDNEYFEIPYEKTRFNVMINAAGSMATGFAGEAKMGRVELTWNNDENDFDDAMGFNIYRYSYVEKDSLDRHGRTTGVKIIVPDTIRVNQEIVDIETTEYTDYDVTPGKTYYYMYKVLSTDLKEYDVSNVVAVTPLTASLGDANGSGDVDVADVITTVNYAAGMEPRPFIFEAADMNTDLTIDILDVVGIIQKILNPSAAPAMAMAEASAIYTVEDGILYVESPVALAGVQVQLNMPEMKDITVAEDLNGFEHTSAWLSDNDYLFLAYNMNGKTLSTGKHALLKIGDAEISSIRLSNAMGGNVPVEGGEGTTRIDAMGSKIQLQGGVYNLKGQKVAAESNDLKKLPKGVYIINGQKVVK